MKNKLALSLLIVLSALIVSAQSTYTLSAKLENSSRIPLEYATVIVLKKETKEQNVTLSDSSGTFRLSGLTEGHYLLRIKHLGTEEYTDSIYLNADINLGLLTLKSNTSVDLKNVVVRSTQTPPIEQLADRFIVYLNKAILNKSKSVYQALNYAPGIIIDQNGISLNGKRGVSFMLNGKKVNLNERSISTFLRGLRSEDVKKIEIIANPGAQYDASSANGIIDIYLDKNAREGIQVNIKTSATFAYQPSYSIGPYLSWKKNNLTLYGSWYFDYTRDYYKNQENIISSTTQDRQEKAIVKKTETPSHSYRAGMNYHINKKHDLGLETYGVLDNPVTAAHSLVNVFSSALSNSSITMSSDFYDKTNNNTVSLNYDYSISDKQRLSVISDYTHVNMSSQADFAILSLNQNDKYNRSYRDDKYRLLTSQIDYSISFNEKYKISAGGKFYNLNALIDEQLLNLENQSWIPDSKFTYKYQYRENLLAVFSTLEYKNKSVELKGGLRSEWLDQSYDHNNSTKQLKLFPSLSLKRSFEKNTSIAFSYSKHVTRGPFRSLIPFYYFESPYTISMGNENLTSSYTDTYNATLGYKNYSLKFSYDAIDDMIYPVASYDTKTGITYLRNSNIRDGKIFHTTVDASFSPVSWWNSFNSIIFEYKNFNDPRYLLSSENSNIKLRSGNIFKLSQTLSIEANALAMTRSLAGPMISQRSGLLLDAGISKSFLDNKWIVNLNLSDVFGLLNNLRENATYNNFHTSGTTYMNSQKVSITLEYNFQKGKKYKQNNNRANNWTEKQRIK